MLRLTRVALVALGATVGAIGGTALVATNALPDTALIASAARPPCHDSNGARPGGVVYVVAGRSLGCDVARPQTLTVTRVRTLAACDDMGGDYSAGSDTCWRVDY
jgi:hypothetical protein